MVVIMNQLLDLAESQMAPVFMIKLSRRIEQAQCAFCFSGIIEKLVISSCKAHCTSSKKLSLLDVP